MKVADVMTLGVDMLETTCTVQQAATRMAELDVGAVLVGSDDVLAGILTDRDIILRVVVDARDPSEVTLGEVMSSTVFTCSESDTVEAAFAQMRERQVRRLPVRNEAEQITGIVVMSDLARTHQDPQELEQMLRKISEPHRVREHPEPRIETQDAPAA